MKAVVDMPRVIDFLVRLLNTPSPVGYCDEAVAFVRHQLEELDVQALHLDTTTKGALVATWAGRDAAAPRAVSAHLDTLGAMVREVKANGRLMITQLGGYAWPSVESEGVTIHCVRDGRRYRGTIQTVNPSVHTGDQMREGKREEERMEVRIDARTSTKGATLSLGIDVGDLVFLDPRVEITETGFVKSRHLDDKAGAAVLYGALLTMKAQGWVPAQRTTFFFSNYEEVGHGASVGIPTDVVELLVVDMAASTTNDHQNSDEYSVGLCAKDATGPYDLAVRRKLVRLCEEHEIPYRVDTYPHYASDGSAYLRAGGNVRVGLIGPGVDASHAYERTHRDSLEASIQLLVRYLLD